jgi:hypothetical protein
VAAECADSECGLRGAKRNSLRGAMLCCHGSAEGHTAPDEIALQASINFAGIECFGEKASGSGRGLLKASCSRQAKAPYCESDGDAELLLCIPFTADVRLKSLCVSAGTAAGTCPLRVKLFCNSHHDIGEAAEAAATQELTLTTPDEAAELWHSLKIAKFNNCSKLQLYFSGRLGQPEGAEGPDIRLYYVGLRAEAFTPRVGVVKAVYESRAQLSDHKAAEGGLGGASSAGMM